MINKLMKLSMFIYTCIGSLNILESEFPLFSSKVQCCSDLYIAMISMNISVLCSS